MPAELQFHALTCLSRRALGALALLLSFDARAGAQPSVNRPRLPPGRDLGASAIPFAIVDSGIDYRDDALARRLARDGEGGLVGWDDDAGDALPFDRPYPDGAGPGFGTALARIVLAEAGASKLVPVRRHPTDPLSPARGLSFAARTPARVVLLGHVGPDPRAWGAIGEAVSHYRHLLIVTWGGARGLPPPGLRGLPNLLVIAAVDAAGRPLGPADPAGSDVAVPADDAGEPWNALDLPPAAAAAARATALAVRLLAVAPDLAGAALKARILSHAVPLPAGSGVWLARAKRLYWLE